MILAATSPAMILLGLGAVLMAAAIYGAVTNVIGNVLFRGRIKPLSKRTIWSMLALSVVALGAGGGMYALGGTIPIA